MTTVAMTRVILGFVSLGDLISSVNIITISRVIGHGSFVIPTVVGKHNHNFESNFEICFLERRLSTTSAPSTEHPSLMNIPVLPQLLFVSFPFGSEHRWG